MHLYFWTQIRAKVQLGLYYEAKAEIKKMEREDEVTVKDEIEKECVEVEIKKREMKDKAVVKDEIQKNDDDVAARDESKKKGADAATISNESEKND